MAFDSSLSSSVVRPPLASAHAPSMADTLPSINFGFEDLRDRMTKFTVRFDEFIEKGRRRVLEERNQFRMNVAELQEDQRMRKKDIEILTLKSNTHSQSLQKEEQEKSEMQSAIAAVTTQRDEQSGARDRARRQIAETQGLINQRLESQQAHAHHLDSQARFNLPELEFWQDYLCLRIEGAGVADRLKFVYSHMDDRDWEKEAWFELGVGRREYEVLHCRPKLEKEKMGEAVEALNQSRDLGAFLKKMRQLFLEVLKN